MTGSSYCVRWRMETIASGRAKPSKASPIMLKSLELVAFTVLFWIACFTALASGACEPWASKTDPTDVPKSHVQDVT